MRSICVQWLAALAGVTAAATVDNGLRLSRRQDDEGAESGAPERKTDVYRRRAQQEIVTMGDYLWFNGGEMSNYYNGSKEDGAQDSLPMNVTMAISLTKSWSNETVEFINTEHPDILSVNSFGLWADPGANKLYRWGGSMPRGADMAEDVELLVFGAGDDGTGQWEVQKPFDEGTFEDIVGAMGGASTSCGGRGYYIGGMGRASTDTRFEDVGQDGIPVPGILSYRFERREWRNDTTAPMNQPYGEIINAEAHCADGFHGSKSLVFLVGGAKSSRDNASKTVPNSMTNITFWNPDDNSWLAQRTTGDAPNNREHHCVVGARGSNSYEIFLYGGENPKTGTSGTIHILSLPAFRWFRADVTSPGRIHHACAVAGNRQMISTGGVASEWDWEEQDPWRHSLGVFDMTDLEWKDGFDPDADDYETPQMIREWYDDNNWENEVEWDDIDAQSIFVGEWGDDTSAPDATESSTPEYTGPNYESSDDDSSATPVGAIAGGVVGGVAGLALIGGLIFFFLRRRRNASHQPIELDSPTSTAAPGTGHGYGPNGIVPGQQAAHAHGGLQDFKADYPSSSPSTQFGGLTNTTYNASPAHSIGPYASPQDAANSGGWSQSVPVEMPTTEHSGAFVEMPTAGHERVEMEDNSRRELVG